MTTTDHYTLLGVNRVATRDDIRAAYKQKALTLHPDKNPNGEALFKIVLNAYQTLVSPSKKCAYDRDLDLKESRRSAFGAPPPQPRPRTDANSTYSRPVPPQAKRTDAQSSKATDENIFKDAYSRYKQGSSHPYNMDTGKHAYNEDHDNFADWFKRKQDEYKVHEEAMKAKNEYAKRLEEEEREKAEAWKRSQREREREREVELEREKERRRREVEMLKKEQEQKAREERVAYQAERAREMTEHQRATMSEMEKHMKSLNAEKDALRAEKERLAREKAEALRDNHVTEGMKRSRDRQREEDIAAEIRAAEQRLQHVQVESTERAAQQAKLDEERRRREAREERERQAREEEYKREEERRIEEERIASEERKAKQSEIGKQRRKVMDDVLTERKKHDEEMAEMRRETDRIENEMRMKLEALRQAKREGRTIDLNDFKM